MATTGTGAHKLGDPKQPSQNDGKNSRITEAEPETIEISTINLPDGRVLKNQLFGLDNTINDEIHCLIMKDLLDGRAMDYRMRYVTPQVAKTLECAELVEEYLDDLSQDCTIYIEPKNSTTTSTSTGLGINVK